LVALLSCQFARADVVFIVDSSRSICGSDTTCPGWSNIRNFIINIINKWNIGTSGMRVGIVRYSSSPDDVFFLQTYGDKTSLINAMSNLQYSTKSSSIADVAQALNDAQTNQFTLGNGDRLDAPNVAIVISNGGITNATQVAAQALRLRQTGVTIFTVGITPATSISNPQIQAFASISTLPQSQWVNYFLSPNTSSLNSLVDYLVNDTCYSASSDCSTRVLDLIFLLDSSSVIQSQNAWSNILSFVSTIVSGLTIGPSAVQVGVTTFSDTAQNPITLNRYSDKNSLLFAISNSVQLQTGGSNIYAGLNAVRTQQFTSSNGDRNGVRNVVVFISGSSSSVNGNLLIPEARNLEQAGVKVYAVGATTQVNLTELVNVASAPHIQYHQWWYVSDFNTAFTNIIGSVDRELCRPDLGNID